MQFFLCQNERERNEVLGYVDFWRRNFICLSNFFQEIFYPFKYLIKSDVRLFICFVLKSHFSLYVSFSNHQILTVFMASFGHTNLQCKNYNSKTFITNLSCCSKLCICFFLCPAARHYNPFFIINHSRL